MVGTELSQGHKARLVRAKVNEMLAGRVLRVNEEPLNGFVPKGPETEGICGDCGDGACEGCP